MISSTSVQPTHSTCYGKIKRCMRGSLFATREFAALTILPSFIYKGALQISQSMPKKSVTVFRSKVYQAAVLAPAGEEFFFRGIVLGGIRLLQYGLRFKECLPTNVKSLKNQKTFRIYISAIAFAATHLLNDHKTMGKKLMQITWCFVGGVVYARLAEKYNSLAPSIIAHATNNLLALTSACMQINAPIAITSIVVNKIFFYWLGNENTDESAKNSEQLDRV